MNQTNLVVKSALHHWSRTSVSCLMLLIAMSASLCAFSSPAMAARLFTAVITPGTKLAGQAGTYTLTVTNVSTASETLGSTIVTVPAAYAPITLGSTSASAGKSWSAVLTGNSISFRGTAGGDKLSNGQSASFSFSATAPATAGTYTFTTTGNTNTGTGGLSMTLSGSQPAVVVAPNAIPVAGNDFIATDEDTPLTVNAPGVLVNDTDGDAQPLTAVLLTQPAAGQVTLNGDGSLTYTPNADFNGTDSFTYSANDGVANSAAATVEITIAPVADDPVADTDAYNADEDTALNVAAPGVLDNDSDVDGDSLTAVLDDDVQNGTLVLNADGSFDYTPADDFNGIDSFRYHANDGSADSDVVTVTITVAAVNDAPVAIEPAIGDGDYETTEETLLQIAAPGLLDNFTDTDGDTLTAVLDDDVQHGTLVLNADGSFDYTPGTDYVGTDTFTFHANDGADDSDIVTVTIAVRGINDAPVANADTATTLQDNALSVTAPGVLGNDTDAENDGLTAVLDANVTNGTLTLNSDGSYNYAPNTGFSGTDSFTYHANDGSTDGNVATVTITVTRTYTISGFVRIGNVTPVAGVNVTRTGGVTVQTDSTGRYLFTGLLPGSFTVTPSLAGYTFSPISSTLVISTADRAANFIASPIVPSYNVIGRVSTSSGNPVAGVTVTRSGAAGVGSPTSVVTNSAGYFTFPKVINGTYTLTPTQAGYTFVPATKSVTVNNADVAGQNFITGWSITGRITTSSGTAIDGVSVSSGVGTPVITNAQGYYTLWGLQSGTYIVTPSKNGVVFTPNNKTVTVGTSNIAGQNFLGVSP